MTPDRIIVGDAVEVLGRLAAGCAHLAFCDPPANLGLAYDVYDDHKTRREYLGWTSRWLAAVVRMLRPDGCLWVQVAPRWAGHVQVRIEALGLHWRNTVAWCYRFGPHMTSKFCPCHQELLYFVMDPDRHTFNADAVRVPSDRLVKYHDKRANPAGRVPSDWWEVKRIAGTHKERADLPCQTPVPILTRILRACTHPGDLVLDPFAGSGSALVAAKKLGRHFLGIELSERYAAAARRRLVRVRPLVSPSATEGGYRR
jgi:site-specific DNA-methyltransferase (adenine-specific)